MSANEAQALQEENKDVVQDVQDSEREAKIAAAAEIGEKRKAEDIVDADVKKAKTDVANDADAVEKTDKGKGKAVGEPSPEPSLEDDSDVEVDLPPRKRANIDYSSAEAHKIAGVDPNAPDEDEKDEDAKIVDDDAEASGDEAANEDVQENDNEDEDDDEEK